MRTACTAAILTVMLPSMVRAATFVVDSTQDAPDAVANGVCATASAACTLRAAVQEANSTPSADVVQVPAGTYVLTQPGNPFAEEDNSALGDLDVTGELTIVGAGSAVTILDGDNLNHSDRIVHVLSGTVEIRGVTIRAGYSLWNGGGILNQGTLTVRQSVITDNHADGQGATGGGGGIANVGVMTLVDSTVTANTSGESAGGVGNFGTTIERCIIANNHVPDVLWPYGGGGLGNQGTLVIRDSTVRDNSSGQNAGGIGNLATATVERCAITGNHAAVGASLGGGGGLGNASWFGASTRSTRGRGTSDMAAWNPRTSSTVCRCARCGTLYRSLAVVRVSDRPSRSGTRAALIAPMWRRFDNVEPGHSVNVAAASELAAVLLRARCDDADLGPRAWQA